MLAAERALRVLFSGRSIFFKIEKDQVTICAPTSKITQRGDTLGGINLTIVISAPYEEVLRVQTYHHMGVQKKAPSFEIAPAESGHLKAEDTEDKLVISSGTLRLEVQKENGALTFYRGEEKITASGWRDLAYVKTDWKGFAYDKGPEDAYMREQLSLSVGELIYGLGERFSAFVKMDRAWISGTRTAVLPQSSLIKISRFIFPIKDTVCL